MVADVVILDDDDRDSVIHIDNISSNSTHSSTGSPRTDGDRKRKLVVSSKVSVKKPKKNASPSLLGMVDKISSSITEKQVRRLFEIANISPADYEFLVPSKDQRANRPPQGYISVYAEQIAAGLRFPMHDMVVRVCNLMQVSPSQLVPNAHRKIVGFILCAMFYGIPLTGDYFFSLFYVSSANVKGLFYFGPIRGKNFLSDKLSDCGRWKKKFFFLRPKGSSWNCTTKWSKTFSRPAFDFLLAEDAIEKGIMNHHFRVNELTCKKILVRGGIEPGVPSAEFTFRYLMHKASVTKFELLPEDNPPVRATIGGEETPSTVPPAANTNPPTLTAYADSPAQPSSKQPVSRQLSLSTPSNTEIPSATEMPIREHLPISSEDDIHLNNLFCKENQNQEFGSCEAHMETNSTVPVSDEANRLSVPAGIRTLWQTIESTYVPKDHYQKLKKDVHELSSELTYTNSRIRELEQELELSEAKQVDSEIRSSLANEALKKLEKRDIVRDSELARTNSRILELERKLELSEARRVYFERRHYLANEAMKNLEKRVEDIKSDSYRICDKIAKDASEAVQFMGKRIEDFKSDSERYRDQIAKDAIAIEEFKFSNEFLNASTYYMDAFDINFLNMSTDEGDK